MEITTGILGLFLLAGAYAALYWAKKCYDELKLIREERQKRE